MLKYNPSYAPVARIVLRYLAGGGAAGSGWIGEALSTDPDAIMLASIAIGATVEGIYWLAKRKGLAT